MEIALISAPLTAAVGLLTAYIIVRQKFVGRNVFDAFPSQGESYRLLSESLERVRREGVTDVLALLPYAIPRPAARGGGLEARFWSVTKAGGTMATLRGG